MEIVTYSYKRHGMIEFIFDKFPNSKAILYPIKSYYFIRTVRWDPEDPVVSKNDLEAMEIAANELLGTIENYRQRKNYKPK
ncbi:hypothetical protein [Cytobacillus praedii]|uniref:hypothetical protein n=1 Tax=Cytobacillus praedii TaxID=1742358 RepID=UPI002E1E53C1|nr:hypothetical protein [Cytobacillus praedii]